MSSRALLKKEIQSNGFYQDIP